MVKKKNDPVQLMPIADSVQIVSQKGVVRLKFLTTRLDKTLLPNHEMILFEVAIASDLAASIAEQLYKHGNRGNAEKLIKKVADLPPLPKLNEKDR